MADKTGDEKRKFVRALSPAQVKVKVVDREEIDHLRGTKSILLSPFVEEDFEGRQTSGLFSSHQMEFLMEIDNKLDKIINLLEKKETDGVYLNVIQALDVSGSGMGLIVSEKVEEGRFLSIALKIPGILMGKLNLYGEVVRIVPCEDIGKPAFDLGVRFIDLTEEEREWLIAYSFSQQRKAIRFARASE
ncbi:MAG: PilZ domain-containing protein [Desulfobacterales bacterium]|nr:PilZ domain-containing protein [Desulfobacterales bacterium]